MTVTTTSPQLGHIHALLADNGYEISEPAPDRLRIQEVLEGEILFFSLTCTVVPRSAITPGLMGRMLSAENGISTSHFQLYELSAGKVAVTLNNFCKLQEMGSEDEDDILSCVHFLLADVLSARRLLAELGS